MLCPVDKINDNKTLGPDCTWLEFGTVGAAVQYWTHAMAVFII